MSNSIDMDAQMQRHLEVFKVRPRLYVSTAENYQLVENYLAGYLDGLSAPLRCDFSYLFTRWYKQKHNMGGVYDFLTLLPELYPGKSEKELRYLIVEAVAEYFREHPLSEWYGEEFEEEDDNEDDGYPGIRKTPWQRFKNLFSKSHSKTVGS